MDEREEATLAAETDRIYTKAGADLVISEEGGRPQGDLVLARSGFDDVVLWNIWEEGAAGMADMGAGEWQNYLCVEAGQIMEPVKLAAGENWGASQKFSV